MLVWNIWTPFFKLRLAAHDIWRRIHKCKSKNRSFFYGPSSKMMKQWKTLSRPPHWLQCWKGRRWLPNGKREAFTLAALAAAILLTNFKKQELKFFVLSEYLELSLVLHFFLSSIQTAGHFVIATINCYYLKTYGLLEIQIFNALVGAFSNVVDHWLRIVIWGRHTGNLIYFSCYQQRPLRQVK